MGSSVHGNDDINYEKDRVNSQVRAQNKRIHSPLKKMET